MSIRTLNRDVFVIHPYHIHAIKLALNLDPGSRKHRQLFNLSDLEVSLGEDFCATLLGLYVFNGAIVPSKGRGRWVS